MNIFRQKNEHVNTGQSTNKGIMLMEKMQSLQTGTGFLIERVVVQAGHILRGVS